MKYGRMFGAGYSPPHPAFYGEAGGKYAGAGTRKENGCG